MFLRCVVHRIVDPFDVFFLRFSWSSILISSSPQLVGCVYAFDTRSTCPKTEKTNLLPRKNHGRPLHHERPTFARLRRLSREDCGRDYGLRLLHRRQLRRPMHAVVLVQAQPVPPPIPTQQEGHFLLSRRPSRRRRRAHFAHRCGKNRGEWSLEGPFRFGSSSSCCMLHGAGVLPCLCVNLFIVVVLCIGLLICSNCLPRWFFSSLDLFQFH